MSSARLCFQTTLPRAHCGIRTWLPRTMYPFSMLIVMLKITGLNIHTCPTLHQAHKYHISATTLSEIMRSMNLPSLCYRAFLTWTLFDILIFVHSLWCLCIAWPFTCPWLWLRYTYRNFSISVLSQDSTSLWVDKMPLRAYSCLQTSVSCFNHCRVPAVPHHTQLTECKQSESLSTSLSW